MSEPRFVEAIGPDVDTAIKNGLEKLGASSKDVIVEVLEEANRGLFGIGGHPARVRLTLLAPPTPPAPPKSEPAPAKSEAPAKAQRPKRSRPKKKRKPSGDRDGGKPQAGPPPQQKRIPPQPDDEEARISVEALEELLAKMKITANIEAYYVEPADETETGPLVLQVTGDDLGRLIGRRGDTLASLQYITRLIVSRDLQRRANIVVDVEHYKARREQQLHSLALRMAKQATQRERTVTLEPMPAYERRIIHLALRDRTDVYTESVGEGDGRKVTIIPVRDR